MPDLKINTHYNFSVYANSILGSSFTNARLISILDYRTAIKFANVELLHRQVFPYLPEGTLKDNLNYTYYLFSFRGKQLVFADVWIIEDSVEETTGLNYTIRLNNITPSKLSVVRDQLRLLNLDFDIVE